MYGEVCGSKSKVIASRDSVVIPNKLLESGKSPTGIRRVLQEQVLIVLPHASSSSILLLQFLFFLLFLLLNQEKRRMTIGSWCVMDAERLRDSPEEWKEREQGIESGRDLEWTSEIGRMNPLENGREVLTWMLVGFSS